MVVVGAREAGVAGQVAHRHGRAQAQLRGAADARRVRCVARTQLVAVGAVPVDPLDVGGAEVVAPELVRLDLGDPAALDRRRVLEPHAELHDAGEGRVVVLEVLDDGVRLVRPVRRIGRVRVERALLGLARERRLAVRDDVGTVLGREAEVDEQAPGAGAVDAAREPHRQTAEADVERHVAVDRLADLEGDAEVLDQVRGDALAVRADDRGRAAERRDHDVVDVAGRVRVVRDPVRVPQQVDARGPSSSTTNWRASLERSYASTSPSPSWSPAAVSCAARSARGTTTPSLNAPTTFAPASSVSPISGMWTSCAAPSRLCSRFARISGSACSSSDQSSGSPLISACSVGGRVASQIGSEPRLHSILIGSAKFWPAASTLRSAQAWPVASTGAPAGASQSCVCAREGDVEVRAAEVVAEGEGVVVGDRVVGRLADRELGADLADADAGLVAVRDRIGVGDRRAELDRERPDRCLEADVARVELRLDLGAGRVEDDDVRGQVELDRDADVELGARVVLERDVALRLDRDDVGEVVGDVQRRLDRRDGAVGRLAEAAAGAEADAEPDDQVLGAVPDHLVGVGGAPLHRGAGLAGQRADRRRA